MICFFFLYEEGGLTRRVLKVFYTAGDEFVCKGFKKKDLNKYM